MISGARHGTIGWSWVRIGHDTPVRPAHALFIVTDPPTSAARRQRRFRERRRRGAFMAQVEVTGEMITALVDRGDVDEANSSDLDCVGKAITAAARRGLDLT